MSQANILAARMHKAEMAYNGQFNDGPAQGGLDDWQLVTARMAPASVSAWLSLTDDQLVASFDDPESIADLVGSVALNDLEESYGAIIG